VLFVLKTLSINERTYRRMMDGSKQWTEKNMGETSGVM